MTFTAGDGGYTDEDDEDSDGDDEDEVQIVDLDEEDDPEISRIDYRGVIDRIRATCNCPVVPSEPRRSNKVGYEKKRHPDPAPRS